jgi:hypothetical protein
MEQGAVDKVIDGLRRLGVLLDQLPAWRTMLAGALADAGQLPAAAVELQGLATRVQFPFPDDQGVALAVCYLPEVCRQLNDVAAARRLLPHVKPWAGQLLVGTLGLSIEGAADRSIGHLLTTLGLLDEADAAYQSAAQLERSCAFPALAVHTHYWHARMLLLRRGQGDQEHANELLHDVMRVTGELGMHRLNQHAAEAALILPSSSA